MLFDLRGLPDLGGVVYRLEEQPAQEEDEQPEQEEPAPAITPWLPMAAKSEISRRASMPPQFGQAMGASASVIERRASKAVPQ